jgi:hypothetical protein
LTIGELQAQYTLERHHIGSAGGAQSNSSYTVTSAMHSYQAQTIQNSSLNGNTGFLFPERHTLPPIITQIIDVPNDQGKQVHVNWDKSDYDKNYDPDKFYSVWRQDDDGLDGSVLSNPLEVIQNATNWTDNFNWSYKGLIWSYIDTIPALGFDNYSLVAPTLFDSIDGDPALSTFMVVFHDKFAYYESQPDSGYSVDNLAPSAPVLEVDLLNQNAELSWSESLEEDFQYYAIYRSEIAGSFPTEPYETTINTSFTDNNLTNDTIWYAISSFDFNGNESVYSNIETIIKHNDFELNLTVFLEGPFNGTDMNTDLNNLNQLPLTQPFNTAPWNYTGFESVSAIPNNQVIDWILIEGRDAPNAAAASEATTFEQQAVFLLEDGRIVGMDGTSNPSFTHSILHSLFIVIKHRNHLPIMSASSLSDESGAYSWDFSTNTNQAYQSGEKLINGIATMIGGDVDVNGTINLDDKIYWQSESGKSGYLISDLSLDGQSDNKDKNEFWLPNLGTSEMLPD